MNAELDMLKQNPYSVTYNQRTLEEYEKWNELCDKTWSPLKLEDTYSDNKFSKGYRRFLWYDNVMRDSWDSNFDNLLEGRGFVFPNKEQVGDEIPLEDSAKKKKVMEQCTKDMIRELLLWNKNEETIFADNFNTVLASIREIPYAPQNECCVAGLQHAKLHLDALIQKFKDNKESWGEYQVQNIFLRKCALESNQKILLGMYTVEKLHKILAYKRTVEFEEKTHRSNCNIFLLLHELIGVFNKGLEESLRLKPLDITLAQKNYDEDEKIVISDTAWIFYQKHCRMVRIRPVTRRGLMGLIFSLSRKLFGKWFTTKITTSRKVSCNKNGSKKIKCYNYKGNDLMVRVHVGLADWSKRDLYDIDLVVAAKYKLSGCQQRDREAAKQYAEDLRKRKSNSANHSKGPLNKFFTESNTERYIPNPLLGFEMPNPPEIVLGHVAPVKTKKNLKSISLKDK